MNRGLVFALALAAGCGKPSGDQTPITPEPEAVSSSVASSSGDGGESGSGGHGGAYASTSGAVAPGNGGGPGNVSGSRLRSVSYAGDDGSMFAKAGAYDALLEAHCEFIAASDGVIRCMPVPMTGSIHYLDKDCTREVVRTFFDCDSASSYVTAQYPVAECPPLRARSFRASNPRTAPVFSKSSTECYSAGTQLVVDVDEVPPADMVALVSIVGAP
jgi:hypothetical protein